jgi:hypothetical protein
MAVIDPKKATPPVTVPVVPTPPPSQNLGFNAPGLIAPSISTPANVPPPPGVTPGSAEDPSVINYLSLIGAPSDPAARAALATKAGIVTDPSLYTGTAEQNTKLLQILRAGQGSKTGSSVTAGTAGQTGTALGGAITSALTPPTGAAPVAPGAPPAKETPIPPTPTGTGTIAPTDHVDPTTGAFDVSAYKAAATADAQAQYKTVLAETENSYKQGQSDLQTQMDQWTQQWQKQKDFAVADAAQYGGSYAEEVRQHYDEIWAQQQGTFANAISGLRTNYENAKLSAQGQLEQSQQGIITNVANFGMSQAQFQATTQNQALTQFKTLLAQTNVDYSDPAAVGKMTDAEVVGNYGALVDLAVKGGLGYRDAIQEIRNGLFQQAKAAATTAIGQERVQIAQIAASNAAQRLAISQERLQLAQGNAAVNRASRLYTNFKAANTPGSGLLTAATYMSQIEAGYSSGGKGVSALSLLDALVKIDTGGQAIRQGQLDLIEKSGTYGQYMQRLFTNLGASIDTSGNLDIKGGANVVLTKEQVNNIYAQAKKIAAEKIAAGESSYNAFLSGIDSIAADPNVEPDQVYGAAPGIAATQDFINKYKDPSLSPPPVAQEGDTHDYQGVTYTLKGGQWVSK